MSDKKIYKLCIIGQDHTHANLLYYAFESQCKDRIEWIGYANIKKPAKAVEEFNHKVYENTLEKMKFYDDYIELLEQRPDIAIICTDTAMHVKACEETLKRNIHTIIEKPMALNIDDAVKIYNMAQKSSAEVVVNWPIAWFTHFNKAKELADSGIVGKTLRFVYRTPSTWGPFLPGMYTEDFLSEHWWYKAELGGGAIQDYACYGCVLSTWFIDEYLPKKVAGFKKSFFLKKYDIEDYSNFIIEYENAIGEAEGSWSTVHSGEIATGPIVYGTDGTIVVDRYDQTVKVYKKSVGAEEVVETYVVPESEKDIPNNFIDYLDGKADLHEMISLEFNMRAMAVLDACMKAAESGKVIEVKKTW